MYNFSKILFYVARVFFSASTHRGYSIIKKIKIKKIGCFIDSDDPGGAETLVIEICKNLYRYNFKVEIYHFGNKWLEDKCNELKIPNKIVPGFFFYRKLITIPIFSLLFFHFLRQNSVDILHSHLYGSITGTSLATFLGEIPHLGTLHDIYTIVDAPKKIRLLQLSVMLGTKLVAVSEGMKNFYKTIGKFNNKNLIVIRNGTAINRFFSKKAGDILRSDFNIPYGKPIFICVGRLVEIKGHVDLIVAFSILPSSIRPILLLVGDGPLRNKLNNLICQKGLEEYIYVLGQREDVPSLLKLSDCFILSSYSEGLSCSIIEAMAAGLPVIATDVGSNNELVQNDVCGFLVPPNDSAKLATAIQTLVNDKDKLKRFGQSSLQIVRKNFSIDRMTDEYAKEYRNISK